ncbi:MAG: hypothetical protein AABW99_01755 [archaeon]
MKSAFYLVVLFLFFGCISTQPNQPDGTQQLNSGIAPEQASSNEETLQYYGLENYEIHEGQTGGRFLVFPSHKNKNGWIFTTEGNDIRSYLCHMGQSTGENINYLYCGSNPVVPELSAYKQNISSDGTIGEKMRINFSFIFDLSNTTKIPQYKTNETFGGQYLDDYLLEGAKIVSVKGYRE